MGHKPKRRVLLSLLLPLLFLPLMAAGPGAEGAGKLSEPQIFDRMEAERAIRRVYQEDFARKTPEGMRALATKLLGKARESQGSPAQCYVLLTEARSLAAAVPDARLALEAVEETAGRFEVDRVALRKAVLAEALKAVRTPEAARSVAEGYLSLLADAVAASDYEWGRKILASASALAGTAKDAALSAALEELGSDLAEARKRWPAALAAEKTLKDQPDNREANFTSGKFLGFIKDDWASGLKRLEKGSDAALAKLAKDDLLDPKDPASRRLLGNAWWSLAAKHPGPEGLALRLRGARWLTPALEALGQLECDAILPRLEAFLPEIPISRLAWLGVEAPAGFAVARFDGKDSRGWVPLEGAWKFGTMILSNSRDSKDETNRYVRSSVRANWVEVVLEFRGGSPGLYLSFAPDATHGRGTNLGGEAKWNEIKVGVDMGRWNTVKFQRMGDTMKVYLNDRLCYSFSPGPDSYILLKAQRGELRVRKLFAIGYNP